MFAAGRGIGRADQPVEAGEVDDAALVELLRHRSRADRVQPRVRSRARAARVDDEIGRDAAHARDAGRVAGDEVDRVDADAVVELDARLREDGAPQHPFERRAAAREGDQILVARTRPSGR